MREKLIALSMVKGGNWKEVYHFLQQDRKLDSIDQVAAKQLVHRLTCQAITLVDDDYPEAWRDMPRPPFVVYYQGDKALLNQKLVAIVGGKSPTAYMRDALDRLFSQLPVDVGVVCGNEIGVERHIMEITSKRVAILGSGVDQQSGFISEDLSLSELPPGKALDLSAYYRAYHLMCELSSTVCVFDLPTSDIRLKYLSHLAEIGKSILVFPDRDKASSRGGLRLVNKGANLLLNRSDML